MRSILAAIIVGAATPAAGQQGQPAPTPTPIIIRAARMLDVTTGTMLRNPTVVVTGDRVTAVNPATMPADATVMDLGDVTLLPGLIDLHTHLANEISATSFIEPVTTTGIDAAFKATKNARTTLMAGFTTVRDFGGEVTVALGRAMEAGTVMSPRIVPSRNLIGITGGHCDATGFAPGILEKGPDDGIVSGPWEAVEAVRYQIKHGAQVIKICATAGVLSLEGPVGAQQLTYEEMKAIVDEAARHGIKVAAHAHGTDGIKAAVRAGVETIEHGSILDDEAIAMMKEHGTWLVPTTYLTYRINMAVLPPIVRQKAETVIPLAHESLRKAIAAGVKIAFGTDAGVYPHGENAKEFAYYVKAGMTPLAALQSATTVAAEVLGKTDRGAVAPGKFADIIAVPGDPLQDITVTERVNWVMEGGKVVKDDRSMKPKS